MFDEQIARIKTKLGQAQASDRQHEVFGAESHGYQLGRCLTSNSVALLERQYGVALPPDFKAFVENVGNGGRWHNKTGAGPYYGLCALDDALKGSNGLAEPVRIKPDLTDGEWEVLLAPFDVDDLPDDVYEAYENQLFGGLLRVGSQGCTFLYAIALNGDYRGRVVNLDDNLGKPFFAYEKNFLDWYERWLDEIIGGGLREPGGWFGFTMGGDDRHLLDVYKNAECPNRKLAALEGLAKLQSIAPESCDELNRICEEDSGELRLTAVRMLTKFDTARAIPHLTRLIDVDEDHRLSACQSIHWYARQHAGLWYDRLKVYLPEAAAPEAFRFSLYVLRDACDADHDEADFGRYLAASTTNANASNRETAVWALGCLATKQAHVDVFMRGLNDPSPRVVRASLQALEGLTDERLLPAYRDICERFSDDTEYILTNLNHRLREHGFQSREEFLAEFGNRH